MTSTICCIFNLAPHYRAPIYKLMDKELDCDFYFGDTLNNKIKTMDVATLEGYKKTVRNQKLSKSGFLWQHGVLQLIFKPYHAYIITGSPAILSNWVLLILAKILNKKVYAWTHGLKKPVKTKGDRFAKVFYKLCTKVLLYGNYSKSIMQKEGFKNQNLVPIYNSLDYNNQKLLRNNLKKESLYYEYFKNNNPVIIYVGRIQKVKKLDLLIKAVNELKIQNKPKNLVLVGKDIDNNELSELVSKFNLENNVWFYGACYDESKIANLFFNANVCVSPGPVGLTALHALTFGCPVISNDDFENQMPEHEAIIADKTGDFFKNNNLDSLIKYINKWTSTTNEQQLSTTKDAQQMIDSKWNPNIQLAVLKKVFNYESIMGN